MVAPEADSDSGLSPDAVDAINQIFAAFEVAYHNQFHKAFPNPESLAFAKKYWLSSLECYSPVQIVHAARQVIRTQDYLPSIAVIVRACEQGMDLYGLPPARQAYVEACTAPSPKRACDWSHAAVYHAGKAAGWHLLANEAEATAFPVFEYHYQQLCRQVMKGEQFSVERPAALTATVERKLDKEETRARIAKMKEELGL